MTLHEYLRSEARELAMIANEESKQLAADLGEAERLGNDLAARSIKAQLLEKYDIQNRLRTYAPEKGAGKARLSLVLDDESYTLSDKSCAAAGRRFETYLDGLFPMPQLRF